MSVDRHLISLNLTKLTSQQGWGADKTMESCPCGTNAEACLEAGGLGRVWDIELADPSQGKEETCNECQPDRLCPLGLMTLN